MQLAANTGNNTVDGIFGAANNIAGLYNAFARPNTAAPQVATAPAAAPAADWKKYLPWGIGAVVLLVVVGLVMRKR